MYQLRPILKQKDLVTALLYVANYCNEVDEVEASYQRVQGLIHQASRYLGTGKPDMLSFKSLLTWYYRELAFSGTKEQFFKPQFSLVNCVVETRTGIPAMLAVLFCHIAQRLGFDVGCVGFPGQFLIRWQAEASRAYFVEPSSGKFLEYADLLTIYLRGQTRQDAHDIPLELFEVSDEDVTLIRILHNLKAAYINEKQYADALHVCDLIVGMIPHDPYARRDRALLLDQLDCKHTAMSDYQYFVEHCPNDPMIGLVESQLNRAKKQAHIIH